MSGQKTRGFEVRRLAFPALIAGLFAATACISLGQPIRGSGQVTSETRTVSGFTQVVVTNQGDLEIHIGEREELVIEAEANLLPHISSEVEDGKLILGTTPRGKWLRPTEPIRYHLTVRALEGVHTSSSGDIRADRLEAERFSVRSSSSGDIDIRELYANQLTVDLSSSGDVSIGAGEASSCDLTLSSSGDFEGDGVTCREAEARLSSSGDARIRVEGLLSARLSSSGNLYVEGNPRIDSRVTSSGRLVQRD